MNSGESSLTGVNPYSGLELIFSSNSTHTDGAMLRLRNPFITLYSVMTVVFSERYFPISSAVSSGFFLDILRRGNVTRV
jgi:hypothetical protein